MTIHALTILAVMAIIFPLIGACIFFNLEKLGEDWVIHSVLYCVFGLIILISVIYAIEVEYKLPIIHISIER